jgi:hypothetical protein
MESWPLAASTRRPSCMPLIPRGLNNQLIECCFFPLRFVCTRRAYRTANLGKRGRLGTAEGNRDEPVPGKRSPENAR